MISKNQIKLITQLQQKKYRIQHQLFIAEGQKLIEDLLDSGMPLKYYISTDLELANKYGDKFLGATPTDFKKISALSTPNHHLAVFDIPSSKINNESDITLCLDDVRDPGNLGTIIRLCDWYGITDLKCSIGCADAFNPKVVQASMGSIARIQIEYIDLVNFLNEDNRPKFGTFMHGENIYKTSLPKSAIIVMGNEGKGISDEIENLITHKITIPKYNIQSNIESLNVAMATGIILHEFRRS